MQFSQKQSTFQEISNNAEWNGDLFNLNKEDLALEKCCHKIEDKTQVPQVIESGVWRTNGMIENPQDKHTGRALTLNHLTSFEEKSMEDHGKMLKNSLENYLKLLNKNSQIQNSVLEGDQILIEDWEDLQTQVNKIYDTQLVQKKFFLDFLKANIQAQLILKQMFHFISKNYLLESLIICEELFKIYKEENLDLMEDYELETYVLLNYSQIAEYIKERIQGSSLISAGVENIFQFQQMIKVWMQVLYLALHGVFENPSHQISSRPVPEGFETFYTCRKLIKID